MLHLARSHWLRQVSSLYLCVCVCVCMCVRACVCACMCVCTCVIQLSMYVPTYVALVNVPVDGSMLIKVTPE